MLTHPQHITPTDHATRRTHQRLAPNRALLLGLLLAACTGTVLADADVGGDVFDTNCADCHSLKSGRNKKGPSLAGVVGRGAGKVAGFANYSTALLGSQITWTPNQLDAYLANPKHVIPGGKMKFDGLSSAKERADLLLFLAQYTQ